MVRTARKIFVLAKSETVRSGKGANWKYVLLFTCLALLVIFALSFNQGRFGVAQGLYKVAVSTRGYEPVLESEPRLDPVRATEESAISLLRSGEVDLALTTNGILFDGSSSRSVAAMGVFRDAARDITEQGFSKLTEANVSLRSRYFPVWVRIGFEITRPPISSVAQPDERGPQGNAAAPVPGNQGAPGENDVRLGVSGGRPSPDEAVTPSSIAPPLPFFSTLATVALLSPTFFLSQAYGNSLVRERVRGRGRILLLSPLSPIVIVAGKAVPYVLIAASSTLPIAAVLKAISPYRFENSILLEASLILILIFPTILMFFSVAVVSSLFFKGFKEGSVMMVILHTLLAVYLVTPASAPLTLPISAISPMTHVLSVIEVGTLLPNLSLVPVAYFTALGVMAFVMGAFAFNEEALFGDKSLFQNILDSLDRMTPRPIMVTVISAGSVVIAIIAQTVAVTAMVFIVRGIPLVALLALSALFEEGLKGLPTYVLFSRNKIPRNLQTSLRLAVYTAVGFFVAEKALLLSITDVAAIIPVFGLGLGGLLALPLLIHLSSSFIFTSALAWLGPRKYWGALLASTVLHAALNYLVIRLLTVGAWVV